jgi:hypothetical protein
MRLSPYAQETPHLEAVAKHRSNSAGIEAAEGLILVRAVK